MKYQDAIIIFGEAYLLYSPSQMQSKSSPRAWNSVQAKNHIKHMLWIWIKPWNSTKITKMDRFKTIILWLSFHSGNLAVVLPQTHDRKSISESHWASRSSKDVARSVWSVALEQLGIDRELDFLQSCIPWVVGRELRSTWRILEGHPRTDGYRGSFHHGDGCKSPKDRGSLSKWPKFMAYLLGGDSNHVS